MIVRKIKPEEMIEFNKIGTVAFAGSRDFSEAVKKPLGHSEGYEHTWAAFNEDGVMTAGLCTLPYQVNFDGKTVPMTGIGAVATLPEYRGNGAIRQIMIQAMRQMKEEGQVFSYLYPFSHEYYRKFGYEMCFLRRVARFPLAGLQNRKPFGKLTFFQKNDDLSPYQTVHAKFISNYNLGIQRTLKSFKNLLDQDPYVTRQYTYLWHNDSATAKSYLTFKAGNGSENGVQMKILDFSWTDAEGLNGMLSCLGRFEAQFKEVFWEVPENVDIFGLVQEPYDIGLKIECGGMNRVVDAKKALENLKVSEGEGRSVIRITDGFLPWNNETYEIHWQAGQMSVKETNQEPDTEITVQILARLVVGYYTPEAAELSGHLVVKKNLDSLTTLFPKKNTYINDRF